MDSKPPANWRQWIRQKSLRKSSRKFTPSRTFQMAAIVFLLLFATGTALVLDVPLNEIGNIDSWRFWLQERGSSIQAVSSAIRGERGSLVLGVVNRPRAEEVQVLIDGSEVASFEEWKVEVFVSDGDTISIYVPQDSAPVRLRVVRQSSVAVPDLGREWSVLQGEKVLGNVMLRSK